MTFCDTHRSLPCEPPFEKLPPIANGNKHRDQQLQKVRDLEH